MVAGVRGRAAHGGDTIRARRAGVPGFVHTRRRVHSPGVVSMATRRQAAKPGVGVDLVACSFHMNKTQRRRVICQLA